MKIVGCDISKSGSDSTCISLYNISVPMELKVGDEYLLPQYQKSQLGLRDNDKLIISGFNKNMVSLLIERL